ncbi:hypothetical protein [Paenibacillus sp. TY11]|uniref:hypothetical protein n=1 Tax=Paenibacillus sp. TY11 TaxID=3448633 RepID=UPI004039ED44
MGENKEHEEPKITTIEEGEKQVELILEPHLKPYITGNIMACEVISVAINILPTLNLRDVSSSLKATTSLLIKNVNDLRTMRILAAKGYSTQTATIASSLYESSYMLAYIAGDEELANQWIEHTDPRNLPTGIKKFTEEALKKQVDDYEQIARQEYHKYHQLCMAKHSNPLIQKNHGFLIEESNVIAEFGPEIGEHSIRLSCFALENSISFVMTGLVAYINAHLINYDISPLQEKLNQLSSYFNQLQNESYKKWAQQSE